MVRVSSAVTLFSRDLGSILQQAAIAITVLGQLISDEMTPTEQQLRAIKILLDFTIKAG
jgi:N-acyl-D-aspartate/D-glutamate deacylase